MRRVRRAGFLQSVGVTATEGNNVDYEDGAAAAAAAAEAAMVSCAPSRSLM